MSESRQCTIGKLIDEGVIVVHKDGNHGANYPRVEDFGPEGFPFLTAKSLADWKIDFRNAPRLSEAKARTFKFGFVRSGDILLSHNATVGRVAVVPEIDGPAVIGTSLTQFRVDPTKLLPGFLAIYFASREFQNQLSFVMSQTTRNQVPITEQRRLPIHIPPMPSQKAIADIIFSLIGKIDLNRRMNETLETTARAIFKNWFLDFGPTRAKMRGQAPYLSQNVWPLFPGRLDDRGNPDGWQIGKLADIGQNQNRICQPYEIDPGTAYIALEHMPRRQMVLNQWGIADNVESGKLRFRRGDFLFGKLRPYFHKVGVTPVDGVCTTDAVVINAKRPSWSSFVLMVISSDLFVAFTDQGSTGTKMPRTSWKEMARFGLVLPHELLASAFNANVASLIELMLSNVMESRTLAATRDLILPKLMSGEIRIREAEKMVETVL